jgi:tellurite resistance protein TehA-like permease
MGAIVTAGRAARGGDASIRSLAIPPVLAGLSAGLGLGLGGVLLMPVAAGAGFVATLVIFALIVLARRG